MHFINFFYRGSPIHLEYHPIVRTDVKKKALADKTTLSYYSRNQTLVGNMASWFSDRKIHYRFDLRDLTPTKLFPRQKHVYV